MIKDNCFWLTTIKGQGGSEYYCEAPYKYNAVCENCKEYIHMSDAQAFAKVMIEAYERILKRGYES